MSTPISFEASLEFRRRLDGLIYRFSPCEPRAGLPRWKRTDLDLWLERLEGVGWAVVDASGAVLSLPWNLPLERQGPLPPFAEWISKKGDQSYVYDLVKT